MVLTLSLILLLPILVLHLFSAWARPIYFPLMGLLTWHMGEEDLQIVVGRALLYLF